MKRQHIIWFILGMGLLASMSSCTSATADTLPNIIVVRPALPKVVRYSYCDVGNGMSGTPDIKEYINKLTTDGFIIKTITLTSDQYRVFVVAEKY
jgi:hypothetical protein